MTEPLTVGIVLLVLHFAFVGAAIAVARIQGRNATFWAGAAMILGPIALLLLFIWRGPSEPRGRAAQTESSAHH